MFRADEDVTAARKPHNTLPECYPMKRKVKESLKFLKIMRIIESKGRTA